MAELGTVQPDRRDLREPGLRLLERGEGGRLVEMAEEAEDQLRRDAVPRLGVGHAGQQPVHHHVEGYAAIGMGLRVEEDLGMDDVVSRDAVEIGGREILEILLGPQDVRALIIDIEKVLQVRETVGRAHRLDAVERDRHPVALGQREHQLGLEAALDMHVQFGLGQARDEGVEIGHVTEASPSGPEGKGRLPCPVIPIALA